MNEVPNLGPCCHCGRTDDVRTIVMLSRRGPMPGCGWGCVVCGLPLDGAIAVLVRRLHRQQRRHPEIRVRRLPGDVASRAVRTRCRRTSSNTTRRSTRKSLQ